LPDPSPGPLRGNLSRNELKRRSSVLRTHQVPLRTEDGIDPFFDLENLEPLLLLWATQDPEGGLRKILSLLRFVPNDPTYIEKVKEVFKSFSERFKQGGLLSDVVEAWTDTNTSEERYYAAERAARKIGNPAYNQTSKEHIEVLRRLRERYGFANLDAITKETTMYLLTPAPRKENYKDYTYPSGKFKKIRIYNKRKQDVIENLSSVDFIKIIEKDEIYTIRTIKEEGQDLIIGLEQIKTLPFWLSFFFSPAAEGRVDVRLKRLLEEALYKEFLGKDYRNESKVDPLDEATEEGNYLSKPVSEDEDGNVLTLEDTVVDKRWDSNLERYTYNGELNSLWEKSIERAKLSKGEENVIRLVREGYDTKEISCLLNKTAESVYAQTSKAITKLKKVIDIGELLEEPPSWAALFS